MNFKKILFFTFFILALITDSSTLVAWTGPTQSPTGGNVPAPINVGGTDQIKNAGIGMDALGVFGSAYIENNLGIGTANPQSRLHVVGSGGSSVDLRTTGRMRIDGSAAGLWIDAGTNDWFIGRSGSNLRFFLGSDRITFTSTGNVGIGTTGPGYKLDVRGTGRFTSTIDQTGLSSSSWQHVRLGYQNSNNYFRILRYGSAHPTASVQGRVLLGNYVGGSAATGGYIDFRPARNYTLIYPSGGSSGYLRLYAGGSERIRVQSNGNVGIGTTNPAERLHVIGQPIFQGNYGQLLLKSTGSGARWSIQSHASNGNLYFRHATTDSFFGSMNMSLAPSGNLTVSGNIRSTGQKYINNSSPTIYLQDSNHRSAMIHANSNRFYVLRGCGTNSTSWCQTGGRWPLWLNLENNEANFGGVVYIEGRRSGGTHGFRNGIRLKNFSASGYSQIDVEKDDNGERVRIQGPNGLEVRAASIDEEVLQVFGDIRIRGYGIVYASDFRTTSDATLKEDIKPLSDSLSKVQQLQGISFKWKDDKKDARNIGFTAQNVEEVLPELVSENSEGIKSVGYQGVIPVLVEALKEQQEEINMLREQIEEIK